MKKNHWMIILSIYFLVVFFGCAGQAIGTIKGKLVRNNGAPVEKIDMQLLKVIDQGNNEFSWVATAYKATSDEQGDFFSKKLKVTSI